MRRRSSERRPEISATTAYALTSSPRTSRTPPAGAASSGRATIGEREPSKSRRMPASAGRSTKGARLLALRCGVIGTEVDGELDVLRHRGARRELLDVRALEERLRQRVCVHLPLLVLVVDRRRRHVLLGRVLRRVGGDIARLRELIDRVGCEVRGRGAVVDPDGNIRGILRRR